MYGIGGKLTDDGGRRCLMARRLLERGVRFVQVFAGGPIGGSPRLYGRLGRWHRLGGDPVRATRGKRSAKDRNPKNALEGLAGLSDSADFLIVATLPPKILSQFSGLFFLTSRK